MKEIKLSDLVNKTTNKANNQISFHLKARQLKKRKITPEELLNMVFVKPKVKFGLKKKEF
jgi:hypothetical protein